MFCCLYYRTLRGKTLLSIASKLGSLCSKNWNATMHTRLLHLVLVKCSISRRELTYIADWLFPSNARIPCSLLGKHHMQHAHDLLYSDNNQHFFLSIRYHLVIATFDAHKLHKPAWLGDTSAYQSKPVSFHSNNSACLPHPNWICC